MNKVQKLGNSEDEIGLACRRYERNAYIDLVVKAEA
jgi:hypothetical protein